MTLIVLATPIGSRALESFTFHMIQHVTTLMLVGPFLVLATGQDFRDNLNRNFIFRLLTEPWTSFILYATMMVGVHLSPIHMYIMENPWSHYLVELPLYLIIPYLFYFNLLEPKLINRRISTGSACLILWLMMVPETLTGFFIYISKSSAYQNMYEINDQRMGGTIMWTGGMIIDTVWILLAVYHWYRSEELKNEQ
jgi:cytochrome c oxidase assembly factor CtaG